jgi:hypothetical protein
MDGIIDDMYDLSADRVTRDQGGWQADLLSINFDWQASLSQLTIIESVP